MNIDQLRQEPAPLIFDGSMSAYPTITPPGTLDAALAPLAELSEVEFEQLVRVTSQPRSFSLSSKSLKELRTRIPSVANNVPYLLGALSFLYSQIDALGEVADSFESIITKLVEELEFEDVDLEKRKIVQKRLEILLQKNPFFGKFRKIQRLQEGFVPNATSFRTMVDLRPDFGEGDAIVYQGLLKVIQFRVVTDSVNPSYKELVFQLNEESLSDLSKAVKRAEEKLETLKNEKRLSEQFIEIE